MWWYDIILIHSLTKNNFYPPFLCLYAYTCMYTYTRECPAICMEAKGTLVGTDCLIIWTLGIKSKSSLNLDEHYLKKNFKVFKHKVTWEILKKQEWHVWWEEFWVWLFETLICLCSWRWTSCSFPEAHENMLSEETDSSQGWGIWSQVFVSWSRHG